MYKKTNNKISIIESLIYTICLLLCYNIVMVSICSFFKLDGSLMLYGLFNLGIGSVINLVSLKSVKSSTA